MFIHRNITAHQFRLQTLPGSSQPNTTLRCHLDSKTELYSYNVIHRHVLINSILFSVVHTACITFRLQHNCIMSLMNKELFNHLHVLTEKTISYFTYLTVG